MWLKHCFKIICQENTASDETIENNVHPFFFLENIQPDQFFRKRSHRILKLSSLEDLHLDYKRQ